MNENLIGYKIGKITVVEKVNNENTFYDVYDCVCECRNHLILREDEILSGEITECGDCKLSKINSTHNQSDTRLYGIWRGIRQRCSTDNEYSVYYKIDVCPEWENDFQAFADWAYANGYIEDINGHECSLDRIDNSKGYSPDNCRWVDAKTQANNVSRNHLATYNGETHTLSEWADIYGIKPELLYDRYCKHGWSFEDSVGIPINGKSPVYTYNGLTLTLPEWRDRLGIPLDVLRDRLRNGWTIDRAFTTPYTKDHATYYNYNGKEYTSSELSEMSGILGDTIRRRIRNGMSVEDAVNTKSRKADVYYEYKGKMYTVKELADMAGVNIETFRARMKNGGYSVEEAVEMNYRKTGTKYTYKGKEYSVSELVKEFGIAESTLRDRLRQGYSIEDALNIPVEEKSIELEYDGVKLSPSQWGKVMGIGKDTVGRRLRQGFSVEDAITKPVSYRGESKINAIYFIDDNGKGVSQEDMMNFLSNNNNKKKTYTFSETVMKNLMLH